MDINVKVEVTLSDELFKVLAVMGEVVSNASASLVKAHTAEAVAPAVVEEKPKKPAAKKAAAKKEVAAKVEEKTPMEAFAEPEPTAQPEFHQPEPPKAEPAKSKVTKDDIRGFLGNVLKTTPEKHDSLLAVFKKYGAETITQLPEDKLEEILRDLETEADK